MRKPMDFEKYKIMYQQGSTVNDVYETAKSDGLEGYQLYRLLRLVLRTTHNEAERKLDADGLHMFRELRRSANIANEDSTKFRQLLSATLEAAARIVEHRENQPVPREFRIDIVGVPRHNGENLTPEEVVQRLFLGENSYVEHIRVHIMRVTPEYLSLELIPDGQDGVSFEHTMNLPPGAGPFKFINITREGEWQIIVDTYSEMMS
jgi:hypothetical protein